MMNLRYRPLLDGPLWGAFGSYGMDGSRTDRSDMAASVARWLNALEQADAMEARPVQGELGLLVVPETQAWDTLLGHEGGFKTYSEAMWGAYRGFFERNVQADWVHVDDIDGYPVLYAPYPIMWPETVARRLAAWVEAGGTLIAEACPGYFGDRGRVGVCQPNNGLDSLFGASECHVEFMPDIAERDTIRLDGAILPCGGFRQVYSVTSGRALGTFDDGGTAVVAGEAGGGRSLLIGSHVSAGHFKAREAGRSGADAWWRWCLDWADVKPRVQVSNPCFIARLHEGPRGRFLWIVNPDRAAQSGRVTVGGQDPVGRALWGDPPARGRVTIPGRDAVLLALDT
jgi:beta-galactosidase